MTVYGQFCPVSKAMELLDERWTMLVIRELLLGSRHFNELRRGVPRMSPALLSTRLRTLVRAGLVERQRGRRPDQLHADPGRRGAAPDRRWRSASGAPAGCPTSGDADLDPHLLMWDVHRNVDLDAVPAGRTVLGFTFTDVPGRPGTGGW